MFNEPLAEAIKGLTEELKELRKQRERELVSRQDLREAEARILKAIKGASDSELQKLTSELKTSEQALGNAVKENQP